MEERIGESYVTKFWPDDSSAIPVIEETLTRYFKLNPDIYNSDSIFRIVGLGCGTCANILTLELIVKILRTFNPKKKIEIYMADLNNNLLQFDLVKARFKELKYEDIYVFTTVADFYEQNFSAGSVDIVFQYSAFFYAEYDFQCPEFPSFSYVHGADFHEKMEKNSVEILKKLLDLLQIQLKPKGMLISVDFGSTNKAHPQSKIASKHFRITGELLLKYASKYGLKITGIPQLIRNAEPYFKLVNEKQVKFEIFHHDELYDDDCWGNYLGRITKSREELREIEKDMRTSCDKPFMAFSENNKDPELKNKAFDEYLEEILSMEMADKGIVGGLSGTIIFLVKKE